MLEYISLAAIPIASRLCGMPIDASRYQRFVVASMMIGFPIMHTGNLPIWTALLFSALWPVFRIWRLAPGFDATHPEYSAKKRNKGMLWMIGRGMAILPLFLAVGYFTKGIVLGAILGAAGAVWMGLSFRFAPEIYKLTGKPIMPNCYNILAEWSESIAWMILIAILCY